MALFDVGMTTIFFRLANFAVLVLLGIYFFRKKALPTILAHMKEQEHADDSIKEKRHELEYKTKQLRFMVHQDMTLCNSLKEQVVHWREQVALLHERRMNEQAVIVAEMKKKLQEQIENVGNQKMLEALVPDLFDSLRNELLQKMTPDKVRLFDTATVNKLEKEMHE